MSEFYNWLDKLGLHQFIIVSFIGYLAVVGLVFLTMKRSVDE